jgi:hypothetical protein
MPTNTVSIVYFAMKMMVLDHNVMLMTLTSVKLNFSFLSLTFWVFSTNDQSYLLRRGSKGDWRGV